MVDVEDVELVGTSVVVDVEVVDEDALIKREVVVDVMTVVVDLNTHEKPPSVFIQFWFVAQNGVVDAHSSRSMQFGFFGSYCAKLVFEFKDLK